MEFLAEGAWPALSEYTFVEAQVNGIPCRGAWPALSEDTSAEAPAIESFTKSIEFLAYGA
jgi:hypothetical protein